ncbi:MAG TPA: universal stress protein [Planctomycetota bacterium]|nr:universal stress protein [Planctomycetota bacterium]
MFERILVPLDGSREAEAVFPPLRRLLRRKDAEVVLFQSVYLPASVQFDHTGDVLAGLESDALAYLQKQRARLEGEGAQVRTHLESGRPTDAILRAAESLQASLIAMSTHGRSGFVRWMLGSVTEDVLRHSRIPVFVANSIPPLTAVAAKETRTILVPFDGSEESLCVAPLAVEVARLFEASVAVLRVEEGGANGPDLGFVGLKMDGPSSLEGGPDLLDRDLVDAGNRFAREGVPTTLYRVRGDIASKINQLARMLNAEAIVMATHGRQGVTRLITGSVAEEVVRKAEAPVLVRKIGAESLVPALQERRMS